MKPKSNLRFSTAFSLAAAIAAMFSSASAVTITWDANGATAAQTDGAGVWLTAGQWWDGAANVNWITGDDAVFGNAGVGGAVTLASPTIVNSLTLNSFTGTYTLGTAAQTITLNNGITKNTGAGAATIISPVTLTAAQSWNNNSAGLLTVGTGAVNNAGFLLTLGGSGNTTVSSVISGAGGLTKSDAGLVTLSGANTYDGVTTINGGILATTTLANGGSASAIGDSSNAAANLVFGAPTATLRYTGGGASTNRSFTLSSGVGGGATIESSGTGALTFDNTVAIGYGTTEETRILTLSGTHTRENTFAKVLADNGSGATSLVKDGVGTWLLTAANTYTGGSTVNVGTLVFRTLAAKSGTGTHAFLANSTIGLGVGGAEFTATDVDDAFSGAMNLTNLNNVTVTSTTGVGIDTTAGSLIYSTDIGSVAKGLSKFGVNTLTLSGTNSAYTGATTITGGTLSIASVANAGANSSIGAFPTAGATGLILNGGTLDYTGATAPTNRGFTVNANSTINVATPGAKLTMGDFTMTGAFTALTVSGGAGSSLDLGTYNYNFASNQNITANVPVSLAAISSTAANGITVAGSVTVGNVSGTGFFLGGGQILVTGTVNLTGNLTNNQAAPSTITYTGTSFTAGGLRMFDGNTFVVGGSGTLGTLGTFASPITFRGTSTFQYNSSADQIISGNLGINTSNGGKLTMSGSGSLTLTGANTVIGLTTVSNGTLKYGKQTSLFNNLTANWIPANLNVQSGGTLAFNVGGTNEFTTTNVTTLLTNLADSSGATNGMNAGSRLGFDTTNAAGGTFTIADVIANSTGASGGARGLTKLGTGSLVLTNSNTYTGDTLVSAGTLELADNAQLKFVLGAASGSNNSLTGAGTVSLEGDFVIDTIAADALPSGTWTLENVPSLSGAYGANFTVVGFTNAGSDKWTKPNGAKTYTFDETTGILTLAAGGSAYDTWKAANAPGSNPDDDTDADGVSNAVEFVLGGTSLTKDLDKLPVPDASGSNLTFIFERAISSIDPKTALFIETSTDLVTWDTAPSPYTVPDGTIVGPPVTVDEDTSVGFDTVTLSVAKVPDAKKFARLKVVITP